MSFSNDSMSQVNQMLSRSVSSVAGSTGLEKARGTNYRPGFLTDSCIDELLGNDAILERIITTIPNQAVKYLPTFSGISNAKAIKLTSWLKTGKWLDKLRTAAILANRYGSSYIYLNIDDGMDDDLTASSSQIASTIYLTAENCRPDYDGSFYRYDEPQYYQLSFNSQSIKVHTSRLLKFHGVKRYGANWVHHGYQHTPNWLGTYNSLQNFLDANSASLAMLKDADIGVFKFGDLRELMSRAKNCEEDRDVTNQIYNRISHLIDSTSITRKIVIDKDNEEYDFVSRTYTGVNEILHNFRETLLGTSSLPASILFANSESGSLFSEAGSGDRALLAHLVLEWQQTQLTPNLEHLLNLVDNKLSTLEIGYVSTMSITTSEANQALFDLSKSLTSLTTTGIISPRVAAKRLQGLQLPLSLNLTDNEVNLASAVAIAKLNSQGANSNIAGANTASGAD
jgi:phage-related protein (TIGR01555 family)